MEIKEIISDEQKNAIHIEVDAKAGQKMTLCLYPAEECEVLWEVKEEKMYKLTKNGNHTFQFGQSGRHSIYIFGNELESLNLNNWNVLKLEFYDCRTLKHLSCRNNKLEALDIRQCTALKTVDCSHNKIREIIAAKLQNLQTIKASNNRIKGALLQGCSHLKSADFSKNPLFDVIVQGCRELRKLRFQKVICDLSLFKEEGNGVASMVSSVDDEYFVIFADPYLLEDHSNDKKTGAGDNEPKWAERLVAFPYTVSSILEAKEPGIPFRPE